MSITDNLLETLKFCGKKNIWFRLVTSGSDINSYVIDADTKSVTITFVDEKDENFIKEISTKLEELKQIFQ